MGAAGRLVQSRFKGDLIGGVRWGVVILDIAKARDSLVAKWQVKDAIWYCRIPGAMVQKPGITEGGFGRTRANVDTSSI